MTEYLTEQEQIELLKNWIKQYSLVIIAGVCIAIAAISGWRYWQQRELNTLTHASSVYDEMLTMRAQNNAPATLTQAQKLIDHYPKTVYGQMAALMLARDDAVKKRYDDAETQLRWVLKKSSIKPIRQIARLRLARLFIAENKPQDAIQLLEKIDDPLFNGLTDEIKGDAYLALQNRSMAREAYKQALSELPNAQTIRPLLQMKYDNLASFS